MGLILLYYELILLIVNGEGSNMSAPYSIIFVLCIGLAVDAISLCIGKKGYIFRIAAGIILAVYTGIEAMIRNTYGIYFSVSNILHTSSDITSQYSAELARCILPGAGIILLLMLPLIGEMVYRKIKGRSPYEKAAEKLICKIKPDHKAVPTNGETIEVEVIPENGAKAGGMLLSRRKRLMMGAGLFAIAVGIHILCSELVKAGPDGKLYDSNFTFNHAVQTFGLNEATLLSMIRDPERENLIEMPAAKQDGQYSWMKAGAEEEAAGEKGEDSSSAGDAASAAADSKAGEQMTSAANPSNGKADSQAAPSASPSNGEANSEETPSASPSNGDADSKAAVAAGLSGTQASPKAAPEYNVMDLTLPSEDVSSSAKNLTEYIKTLKPSEKNEFTGLFKGKNLIMICAESYCDTFITPELTPTLWRLTHNGFYFPDYYQPSWGGSTSTGELSMILGFDGNEGDETMQHIADNNHYFSMGNQLRRQGYFSAAFHNGHYQYYRRDLTHKNLGYDVFIASGNGLSDFTGHSYPSDSEMIAGTIPYYIDKEPFSIYYMTVSGHPPYLRDSYETGKYYDRVNELVGDQYKEKTKYYICYQMELENALSILVDELEKAGKADDTVIVLTSDHYPYGLGNGQAWANDQNYINDLVKDRASFCWNADQSGLIIWSGCLEHEYRDLVCEVDEPVMSLDILPTVSNLFGVEFDSRLLPGRDALADTEPLVYWNNLCWMTKEGKYDRNHKVFYPSEKSSINEENRQEYIEYMDSVVNARIKMSTLLMKTDYYSLIKELQNN